LARGGVDIEEASLDQFRRKSGQSDFLDANESSQANAEVPNSLVDTVRSNGLSWTHLDDALVASAKATELI
jgi:hypothetical protein